MAIITSYSMLLMPSMVKTIDQPCPAVFRWVSLPSFINPSIHRFIKLKTIMARNYKVENGKHLKAIRSPYDGRVVGWIDITESSKKNS